MLKIVIHQLNPKKGEEKAQEKHSLLRPGNEGNELSLILSSLKQEERATRAN